DKIMVKKINIKEKVAKIKTIPNRTRQIVDDIFIGEKTYNKIVSKFVNASKVFIVATRKFLSDNCTTKASSIAYTTIVSLLPTLTVLLTLYSIFSGVGDKKDEIFKYITRIMLENNIKLNIEPFIETISDLIENSKAIGGIGAVIMIFSATALLRTMEQTLNDIYNIAKSRSILLKIIYYWAALSLGPIIVGAGTFLATQVTSVFSSPNYNSGCAVSDSIWIAGDKGKILITDKSKIELKDMSLERIDFDNQRIFQYDAANNTFREYDYKIEEREFKTIKFSDIQFINNYGWITGKDGIVLNTRNGGKSWYINKFGSLTLNDINMIDPMKGFIAADNGYILSTADGGMNWTVNQWEGIRTDLKKMAFLKEHGIACGDNGTMAETTDGGKTWNISLIEEAKKKRGYLNLNNIFIIGENDIVITSDEGTIITSDNGGKTWKKKKFMERNYSAVYFSDVSSGYIAGDKGELISTTDGGNTWQRIIVSKNPINILFSDNGVLWAIGDMGLVKKTSDGVKWEGIHGGNFVLYLLNFLTPFISIWLLFLLIYIVLPNMKIPFKPAAIGAAFTSIVWVIFILFFTVYIKYFAKGTLAVYGALAAVPIFLLLLYSSSLIVLYGAEVSYALMNPHLYRNVKKGLKDKKDANMFYGISILYQIYHKFESGRGSSSIGELLKISSHKDDDVSYFISVFKKEKLIIEAEEGNLIPANSSKNIQLSDVITLLHDVSLTVPAVGSSPDKLKKYIGDIFSRMKSSKDDIVKGISLTDVIENAE
ncbi:MAG: YihY family inner membrane protein, partial [Spirochaetes bacterium]|nr:YihY family inner membrane protein [Spirochaetota bacterium]